MESELKKNAFTIYWCKSCGAIYKTDNVDFVCDTCESGTLAEIKALPISTIKKWLENKKAQYKAMEEKKIYIAGLNGKYNLLNEQIQELCLLEKEGEK